MVDPVATAPGSDTVAVATGSWHKLYSPGSRRYRLGSEEAQVAVAARIITETQIYRGSRRYRSGVLTHSRGSDRMRAQVEWWIRRYRSGF